MNRKDRMNTPYEETIASEGDDSTDWEQANEPIPSDPYVDQFHEAVVAWKKRNLLGTSDKSHNLAVLGKYVQRCRDLYHMLMSFFDTVPLRKTNNDIEEFLPWVQDVWNKEPSTRFAMEHIIQRDLLVYPYILNTEHAITMDTHMRKNPT
jgi:hypothetical protein